ncbi:ribosome maturation factor RimM [Hyphococcus flavus]|uniref:Ribosome maturation factor RimM n=1 Tax=Hyphococcus flavus TaxID=1866326 RepID=A0AAE9ZE86_9PROT|nr:ribosome maturation factor RimM [Hyphococcus flavus]WDI33001.1 ribosome maturation factor RimM [Hyphococcus flavus]
MTSRSADRRICLGAFAGAHGVKGDAKIKSFTDMPKSVATYGPVETEDGSRQFTLTILKELNNAIVLVRAPEIQSREDAESLKGVKLYVFRDALPPPDEDEFYMEDLIGLNAVDELGEELGVIKAVYNFGADDILELANIPGVKGVRLVAFTKDAVPEIALAARRITIARKHLASKL